VWFPVIRYDAADQPWMLLVRRRGDPLDALVRKTRRRNLAMSVGIFLLLAVSLGLVVVASHRAQKLAQLQMDFVASVSHELRTPLTVICSAAENIVGRRSRWQTAAHAIRIGHSHQGRQLTALVDQVLLFASTREGRARYPLRPLSIALILQNVLNNTATLVERAGVMIEKDVALDLPQVMGDLSAVSQCLQNLIVNAVKYGGEMRWIGIRARLDHDHSPPEVLISVQAAASESAAANWRTSSSLLSQPSGECCTDSRNRPWTPARPAYRRSHGRQPHGDKPGRSRSIFTLHLVCSPADRSRSEVSVASGSPAANHEREYSAGGRRRRSAHYPQRSPSLRRLHGSMCANGEDGARSGRATRSMHSRRTLRPERASICIDIRRGRIGTPSHA